MLLWRKIRESSSYVQVSILGFSTGTLVGITSFRIYGDDVCRWSNGELNLNGRYGSLSR